MADGKLIKPDLEFVKKIMGSGGESLKKCYQCATCSVVCNVTPDDKPFPRKEMIHAQWGLKDKLFGNPDIWLCHQCSDCTAYCPRGAKPGEVLGAVRKLSIENYAMVGFLGKALGDPKYLLLVLAIPVLILLAALGIQGHLGIPEGEVIYAEKFMAVPYIDTIFGAAALFAVVGFIAGMSRYWKDLRGNNGPASKKSLIGALTATITEFLAHSKFKKCEVTVDRSTSHLFVFYSFVGLAITTTWAIAYLYGNEIFGIQAFSIFHFGTSPYPQSDPMKIVGNLSALGLLLGIALVISNRIKNSEKAGAGSYYDWLFIGIVFGIVVTGILSEVLRLLGIAVLAYPVYFIHLVIVLTLFAYAPYSKMAHMVYRTTALVYAKMSGRDQDNA
jgi:quinone-modifying oxidoreductase, subunit QmoC